MELNGAERMDFGKNPGGDEDLPEEDEIFSVSRLNGEVRKMLEDNFYSVWVEGEISNFSRSSSGHMYFTLKDEDSEISAIMFSGDNASLDFDPEDGTSVLARGTVTVYEPRGRYQLKVKEMKEAGKGKLRIKFEKLKEKLRKEGLFDEELKKPIPEFPERIGIITSREAAALRDIVSTIRERFPSVELYLFPVRVQGEEAKEEIANALKRANDLSDSLDLDLLITGRGGGSLEDLWAFNEEEVARAIFDSELPVVSAVGHEVDFSISDFVADLRVPTPTAAGKAVVPEGKNLIDRVKDKEERLTKAESKLLANYRERLSRVKGSFAFKLPFRKIERLKQKLDDLLSGLEKNCNDRLDDIGGRYQDLLHRLDQANPTRVLEKGYSITFLNGDSPVRDSEEVEEGDRLETKLYRGKLFSVVEEVDN